MADGVLLNDNDKYTLRPGEVQLVLLNFSQTLEVQELQHAAENGWTSRVESILQRPPDPDLNLGRPPLYAASAQGHLDLEVVRLLLEANADKDKAGNDGYTPLFIAVERRHVEVVRLLLEAKADKDKTTHDGFTPLCYAAEEGHSEVVGLLLHTKADMNTVRKNWLHPFDNCS